MPAPEPNTPLRKIVVAAAIALLFPLVPLPSMDWVPAASASTAPLGGFRAASPAAAAAMAADTGSEVDRDRRVAAEVHAEPFAMIGVSLDEEPDEPVLVRLLDEDGAWSPWHELEVDGDTGPDPGSAEAGSRSVTSEPLWVGDAVGYEVSLDEADTPGAAVTLVSEGQRRVVTESVPAAEAATSPPFPIYRRSSWNARPSSVSSTSSLRLAVVHHTASTNSYSASAVPSILRSIQAYHMDANGWSDIGYNFLVDRFGRIWEGRGGGITNAVIGAHAAGFNTGSVGVSIIGNFVGASPTAASLEATSRVVAWRLNAYRADPGGRVEYTSGGSSSIPAGRVVNLPRVVGHRDVGSTSCPGSVYGSLGSVRNRASALYRSYESLWNPQGRLDEVDLRDRRITIRGWAKDPDSDASVVVHLSVNGSWRVVTANSLRPDVEAAHPGYGTHRGYTAVVDGLPDGRTEVCAYGVNQGRGTGNPLLGCRSVVVK